MESYKARHTLIRLLWVKKWNTCFRSAYRRMIAESDSRCDPATNQQQRPNIFFGILKRDFSLHLNHLNDTMAGSLIHWIPPLLKHKFRPSCTAASDIRSSHFSALSICPARAHASNMLPKVTSLGCCEPQIAQRKTKMFKKGGLTLTAMFLKLWSWHSCSTLWPSCADSAHASNIPPRQPRHLGSPSACLDKIQVHTSHQKQAYTILH